MVRPISASKAGPLSNTRISWAMSTASDNRAEYSMFDAPRILAWRLVVLEIGLKATKSSSTDTISPSEATRSSPRAPTNSVRRVMTEPSALVAVRTACAMRWTWKLISVTKWP